MSSAECVLIHVGADLVAPARSKLVELVVSLMRIAIRVSLEIGQADVSDHINAFELIDVPRTNLLDNQSIITLRISLWVSVNHFRGPSLARSSPIPIAMR